MEKLNEFAKRSALDVSIRIDIYGVVLPSNFGHLKNMKSEISLHIRNLKVFSFKRSR